MQEVLALEAGVGFVGHEHGVAVDDLAVQHAGDDDGEEAAAHEDGASVAEALGGVVVGVLGHLGYGGEVAHRQVPHHRHAGAPCTVSWVVSELVGNGILTSSSCRQHRVTSGQLLYGPVVVGGQR